MLQRAIVSMIKGTSMLTKVITFPEKVHAIGHMFLACTNWGCNFTILLNFIISWQKQKKRKKRKKNWRQMYFLSHFCKIVLCCPAYDMLPGLFLNSAYIISISSLRRKRSACINWRVNFKTNVIICRIARTTCLQM